MKALTTVYKGPESQAAGRAAVEAFKAGNDMILLPSDLDGAYNGMLEAAKSGEWLTVRMRYKHPETDKASEVSSVLPANGLAKEASADLKFAGATSYLEVGDTSKAIASFRRALELNPGNARLVEILNRLEPRL